jgi:Flp pilus assembly pilin Flp
VSGRTQRSERGATLVEFALVVPVLLSVLLGTIQYGYHYWALETASATAREAARRLAVGTDWACTMTEVKTRLDKPAVGTVPDPTRAYQDASGATTSTAVLGGIVTVTVTLPSLDMNLFPVPDNGVITQSAQARIENVPTTPIAC